MKKIKLVLGLLSISSIGLSQNVFPNTGLVGIGTNSPKAELHIKGDARMRFEQNGGYPTWDINHKGNYGLEFFKSNSGKATLILANNDNVGIGTISPKEKLHLKGDAPVFLIEDNGVQKPFGRFYNPKLQFKGGSETFELAVESAGALGQKFGLSNGKTSMTIWNNEIFLGFAPGSIPVNNQKVSLNMPWANKMAIGGKFATGFNLSVRGKSIFEHVEVKLASDWPDYVFQDNYKLKSLEEVENYISENSHLPGIPSAQEVEKSGINIAEMDALLLQKIEELTLYNIELNKKLSAIEAQMNK